MLSKINTCILRGLDGEIIEVETDISRGIPTLNIVGLADTAIKESKERVRSAINNSDFEFPISRITINLSPANIRKEGSQLDLPIALGIMKSIGYIGSTEDMGFIGELSLDGKLNPIRGTLPMVMHMRDLGIKQVILPYQNREEAGLLSGIGIIPARSLAEVVEYINKDKDINAFTTELDLTVDDFKYDFSEIKGQQSVKRAIEIAASGFHNIIMVGPRGSGKTMFAKRIPSIMPRLTLDEALDITRVYSVSDIDYEKIVRERPFRSPHHSISQVSLSGGGRIPKPGEISLAHRGVLFLDELPEFQKSTLEVLRQPLEDREISISRLNGKMVYPADILLVASMNPCNCGNYGTDTICNCSQASIDRYLSKISGPLLDRVDIQIEVSRVTYFDITKKTNSESSKTIRDRVESTRQIQSERYKDLEIQYNSQLDRKHLEYFCNIDEESRIFLGDAFEKLNLSARSHDRILKLSRTIADMERSPKIELRHLAEAIQYRTLDRKYWI